MSQQQSGNMFGGQQNSQNQIPQQMPPQRPQVGQQMRPQQSPGGAGGPGSAMQQQSMFQQQRMQMFNQQSGSGGLRPPNMGGMMGSRSPMMSAGSPSQQGQSFQSQNQAGFGGGMMSTGSQQGTGNQMRQQQSNMMRSQGQASPSVSTSNFNEMQGKQGGITSTSSIGGGSTDVSSSTTSATSNTQTSENKTNPSNASSQSSANPTSSGAGKATPTSSTVASSLSSGSTLTSSSGASSNPSASTSGTSATGTTSTTATSSSTGSKEINAATICKIGQETVQEIVSRIQEVFSYLKSLQLPVGSQNTDHGTMEKQERLREVLKGITLLFKRLRVCYEKASEQTSGMDFSATSLESLVPFKEPEGTANGSINIRDLRSELEKKRGDTYQVAVDEHKEVAQQLTVKNRQLKEIIDQMRNIIWEINTMLAMRQ